MPLIAANLKNDLESLFRRGVGSESEAINAWVSAIQTYALPILPASTTVTLAAQTLRGGLVGFNQPNSVLIKLPTAMAAFAGIVATGMVPTGPPFTLALPPVIPLVIPFANVPSGSTAAQTIAQAIDTWMRTGVGPATALSPWS